MFVIVTRASAIASTPSTGPEIDGAPTASITGPPIGVSTGVFVGVRLGVVVGVVVGVRLGVLVGVVVGVRVGVLVGVTVGVLVGVEVGLAVGGATQAASVLVAPLHGPVELTQLEPAPQKTRPPVHAALAIVSQAPVLVLIQQPVA